MLLGMGYRLSKKRLKVLRAERDKTQIQVAHEAKLPVARYWYLESGGGIATADEVKAIADALGVTTRRLGATSAEEAVSA
jgi:transcriptional regulator with XRE-family HTH domain